MNAAEQYCCHCGKPVAAGQPHFYGDQHLVRPRRGRRVAGVCASFAQAYGLNLTLLRLATILLFIAGFGSVLLVYIAAWIVIPNEDLGFASGSYPANYPPANYPPAGPYAGSAPAA